MKRAWKKPLLVTLALAPAVVLIGSMILMARSEMAFDEATCPYEERETRQVADGVRVREDARVCQEGVEEHRWVLLRRGEEPRPMALRRLEQSLYQGYTWTATLRDGLVRIEIDNPGQDLRVFNEPPPDAGWQ
ncbi:MAG: hypothetical protein RLP09_04540 [Sandaracinaceae bacterium]|nr:MAG: hypothetical protein EVA89_05335 [Sandaracinaceae bacterium]HBQ17882.1 hypothetical protein [Myxococcales bacterium]